MARGLFTQSVLAPDMGNLKGSQSEWENLQNLRGWGNLISRRKGVRSSLIMESGIMGIHDLQTTEDPTSSDKILLTLNNGSLVFLDYSEIYTAFNYLFTGSAKLALQSPDDNWWDVTPNSSGEINPTVIATPSTTISTDLNLGVTELLGFESSSVIYKMSINDLGAVEIDTYGLSPSETEYTTTQAFTKLVGPVFTSGNLQRFRLTCDNAGSLTTTAL
jgi:hypothetical protein